MPSSLKVALLSCLATSATAQTFQGDRYVWDNKPAAEYERNSYPIGSGRLATTIFGSITEQLYFNEETVWSVVFANRTSPGSIAALPEVRQLFVDGHLSEGGDRALNEMTPTVIPFEGSYSTAGIVDIDFHHGDVSSVGGYVRWLDTQTGISGVSYTVGDTEFTREYWASFPQNVVGGQFTSNQSGALTLDASWSLPEGVVSSTASASGGVNEILLRGQNGDPNKPVIFSAKLRFVTDGTATASGDTLSITGASTITFYADIQTNYRFDTRADLEAEIDRNLAAAVAKGYASVRSATVEDVQNLTTRASVDFGSSPNGVANLPTDQRVAQARSNLDDPELLALLWHFARYLLVSSSRKSPFTDLSMPANLQGKWNNYTQAPFGSKYTININIEMIYWPAMSGNLLETMLPLFDLMDLAKTKGEGLAWSMYNCPGLVYFHNLDIYGDGAPTDMFTSSTMWPSGMSWLASMMTEYYRFSGDEDFLRDVAWPYLTDISTFLQCYTFEYNGHMVMGPSLSAENTFVVPDNETTAGASVAMDIDIQSDNRFMQQIMEDILEAADVLGLSDSAEAQAARDFLPKIRGSAISETTGRLMEWRQDYEENNPGNPHISPLIFVYPLQQISPLTNQTLIAAAKALADHRVSSGGSGSGWGQSWLMSMYAHFFDGDAAWTHTKTYVQNFVMPNLFDSLGADTFQMDGNMGFNAGVTETLVQSKGSLIHLLPALMTQGMPTGSIRGIRTRSGFVVGVSWANGVFQGANITATRNAPMSVVIGNNGNGALEENFKGLQGFKVNGTPYNGPIKAVKGETYHITM
ncbi:Alpha-L-fucosidase 2 [Escovopsis weberi]|uniref:Alpha-L-fucosidase 2 n=1 Tax=Escovopsis weberi TaxID=150374 RepID=A0A0M9VW64_ESCWE|nr:Alpha-L-fucosidase 2 [Escovopsis weberi]